MDKKQGFAPILLIIITLVVAAGGVGIGLAWKTDVLDKWLPPNIKETFGRGEKPAGEEAEEEPEEEPEEDLTKDWKTYTNTKYNFQLKVPENFELQELATIEHPRLSLGWMGSSDDNPIGFGGFGGRVEEPLYIDIYVSEGVSLSDKPNFEIDGIPAVKRSNPPEWGEGETVGDSIHFIKNGRLFTIEITAELDEGISEDFREISYLILSTFKFIE